MQLPLYVSNFVPQQLTHLSLQILIEEALDLAFLQVIVDHLVLQIESEHASAAALSSKAFTSKVSSALSWCRRGLFPSAPACAAQLGQYMLKPPSTCFPGAAW